jgi:hypothetical protein
MGRAAKPNRGRLEEGVKTLLVSQMRRLLVL